MAKAVRRAALFCRKFLVWPGPAEPEGTGNLLFLPHTPTLLPGERQALTSSHTVPWGCFLEKQAVGPSSPLSSPSPQSCDSREHDKKL